MACVFSDPFGGDRDVGPGAVVEGGVDLELHPPFEAVFDDGGDEEHLLAMPGFSLDDGGDDQVALETARIVVPQVLFRQPSEAPPALFGQVGHGRTGLQAVGQPVVARQDPPVDIGAVSEIGVEELLGVQARLAGELADEIIQAVAAVHDHPPGFFPGEAVDPAEKLRQGDGVVQSDPSGLDMRRQKQKAIGDPEGEPLALEGVVDLPRAAFGDIDQRRQKPFLGQMAEIGGFEGRRLGSGTGDGGGGGWRGCAVAFGPIALRQGGGAWAFGIGSALFWSRNAPSGWGDP